MTDAAPPVLYHFRVSHYNEKVRWALDFKRWPHVRHTLLPGLHIPRVRWLSGQNKVPVMAFGKRVVPGSNHILDEIERLRPDPPLFPGDPQQRARAMSLQAHFDEVIAPEQRRLFWSCYLPHPDLAARMISDGFSDAKRRLWRALFPVMLPIFSPNMGLDRESVAQARRALAGHFDRIEAEIQPSGYLVGDRFSVADLAVASILTALVRPPEFPYPLAEPWPDELLALRESVAGRAGFQWVLDMYARHRGASSEIAA